MLSPNQIKARLIERGITQAAIARNLRVSHITVSIVVGGYGRSRRIQQYISELLNMKFKDVWNNNHKKAA